jgi:hypothetical protein
MAGVDGCGTAGDRRSAAEPAGESLREAQRFSTFMDLSVKLNSATGTTQGRPLGGASAQACRYVWGPDIGSRPFARRDWQAAGGVGGLLYAKYVTGPNAGKLRIPVTDAMGNVTSVPQGSFWDGGGSPP